jgi:hypothetical protein
MTPGVAWVLALAAVVGVPAASVAWVAPVDGGAAPAAATTTAATTTAPTTMTAATTTTTATTTAAAATTAAAYATLVGTVRDGEGLPIGGAAVEVRSGRTNDVSLRVASDAAGRFRIEGLPPEIYLIWVDAGDLLSTPSEVITLRAGEQSRDLVCARHDLEGRVVSPAGEPVAGARVGIESVLSASRSRVTDAEGAFRFSLLDGWYEISAAAAGYPPISLDGPVRLHGRSRTVEIRLPRREAVIGGRITGLTPRERADCQVSALPPRGWVERAGSVDAAGHYFLGRVEAGEWAITARAGNRAWQRKVTVRPEEWGMVAVDFVFPSGHAVSGRIADRLPPAVDTVTFDDWRQGLSIKTRRRRDGSFAVALPAGSYRVAAAKADGTGRRCMARAPLVVADSPLHHVTLHCDAKGAIAGRVVDAESNPKFDTLGVYTALDEIYQGAERDDHDGYRIGGLAPGPWQVTTVSAQGAGMITRWVNVPADDRKGAVALDFLFQGGPLTLSGRLDGFDPAAQYRIRLESTSPTLRQWLEVAVDRDGTFTRAGLEPALYHLAVYDTAMPNGLEWPLYAGTVDLQATRQVVLPLHLTR